MVKYNPKTWFDLIFHSYSRQIVRVMFPALVFMAIYTTIVCYLMIDYFDHSFKLTTSFHSLLGIVLGLILVFRMNSAYDRWWEGRIHWGALVNNTRNLALKLNAILGKDDTDTRKFFSNGIPSFVYSLKEHLREGVIMDELSIDKSDLERVEKADHKPNIISAILYERVNDLLRLNKITGDQYFVLDKELKSFSNIMGACERIRNTPIPYSYSMYVKKFIFTFTITLPFGFVYAFGYFTIPVVLLLFFTMIGLELISEEIEDPFGRDANDLPTDNIAEKINSNVREILKG